MAYVVKSWETSYSPNQKGEYVRISGRREGILAWLLSLVGIDPTVHIVVTAKNFSLEARTFWGYSKRTIPISRISEVRDGFMRPWLTPIINWIFSLACVFLFFAMLVQKGIVPATACLVPAAIFFGIGYFIYMYRSFLVVGVAGFNGLLPAVIVFKPSFIEGITIDAEAAEKVGQIIQRLMDRDSPLPAPAEEPQEPLHYPMEETPEPQQFSTWEAPQPAPVATPIATPFPSPTPAMAIPSPPQPQATEFEMIVRAAESGNPAAQYRLGVAYFNGNGAPKNREEAMKWLRLASEQGHRPAIDAMQKIERSR